MGRGGHLCLTPCDGFPASGAMFGVASRRSLLFRLCADVAIPPGVLRELCLRFMIPTRGELMPCPAAARAAHAAGL